MQIRRQAEFEPALELNMDKDIEIVGVVDAKRNAKLIEAYSRDGFKIALFPDVSYEQPELSTEDIQILKDIDGLDWIIFTDPAAASIFPDVFEATGRELFDLDALNVCSFGELTSDELRFRQIHSDLVPFDFSPEAVGGEVSIHSQSYVSSLRFLVITAGGGIDKRLNTFLSSAGADCAYLRIAKPLFEAGSEYTKSQALLKGGSIDRFLFANGREVFDFAATFGADLLSPNMETIFTPTDQASATILDSFQIAAKKGRS